MGIESSGIGESGGVGGIVPTNGELVRGNMREDIFARLLKDTGGIIGGDIGAATTGGRYVMPIALCTPARSRFAGMKLMVTSPGLEP